jgi:exonuclease SbcC
MKPLQLEIEGFGPYRDRQLIDFTRLDPTFVITGETGAGKTSIFDAISYALYKEPLGLRSGRDVRSDFADVDTKTRVRFRFAAAGKTWEVTRSLRAVKHRDGSSTGRDFDEEATLAELAPDGTPKLATTQNRKMTPSLVTEMIVRDILHLKHEEFAKILVLPQGEFQRFLELDSKARGEMFAKLFPHAVHETLMNRAAEAAKASTEELKVLSGQRAILLETYAPDRYGEDDDALRERLQALDEAVVAAGEAALAAEAAHEAAAQLHERVKRLRDVDAACVKHEQGRAVVDDKKRRLVDAARAAPVEPAMDRRLRATQELERRRADHALTVGKRAEHDAACAALAPEAEALAARGEALRASEAAVVEQRAREAQLIEAARLAEALRAAEAELARRTQAADVAAQELAALDAALAGLIAARDERATLSTPLLAATERVAALAALASAVALVDAWTADVESLAREEGSCDAAVAAAVLAVLDAQADLERAYERQDREKAAALAERLRPDEPCLVCGSRAHPAPAVAVDDGHGPIVAWIETARARVERTTARGTAAEAARAAFHAKKTARRVSVEEAEGQLRGAGFASTAAWRSSHEEAHEHDRVVRAAVDALDERLKALPDQHRAQTRQAAAVTAAQAAVASAASDVQVLRGQLAQARGSVGAGVDDVEVGAELAALQLALRQQDGDNDIERRAIADLSTRWQKLTTTTAVLTTALATCEAELAQAEAAQQASVDDEALALREAGFATANDARAALLASAEVTAFQAAVDAWTTTLTTLTTQRAALREEVAGREPPALDGLLAAAQGERARHAQLIQERTEAQGKRKGLAEAKERYDELQRTIDVVEAQSRGTQELARALRGENALKLSFSTWVLSWWFDKVLARASDRLRRLSEGRYVFVRQADVTHGNRQAGLDIDVFDAHTTKRRSTARLSGGEKFLASISLALGLADVIQERAGGIELDTLFIDEGFGSLDAATMDRALDVLDEIGLHRQVGVISHVDGVKLAIQCHVVVEASAVGSRIAMPSR